jgi:uncharacterized protein (DUF924 family)
MFAWSAAEDQTSRQDAGIICATPHIPTIWDMQTAMPLRTSSDVVGFWFSDHARKLWWNGGKAFDDELRTMFLDTVNAALEGQLDGWQGDAEGALALVLVLDQLTRNIFRGTPRAFSGDVRARAVANASISRGDDREQTLERRMFLYMPLQHSEELADQKRSMALFTAWAAAHDGDARAEADENLEYAKRHHDIVERFGRFPHRNKILGRTSTPEELEFLAGPNSSF